jgi:hypothetical protein
MSRKRDIPRDQENTRAVMAGASQFEEDDFERNWLGHRIGSKADTIDRMLAGGVPYKRLMRARKKPDAVQKHLDHLVKHHGLTVAERSDGLLAFETPTHSRTRASRGAESRRRRPKAPGKNSRKRS